MADYSFQPEPVSMWFTYLSWAAIEPTQGTFDWSLVEQYKTENPEMRGVLRIYVDYPNLPTGVPSWCSVDTTYYDNAGGIGYSPDYDDPTFLSQILALIAAFGAQYDTDERIGCIQLGILGHFGEWTTYRLGLGNFPTLATQQAILDAYRAAFPNTMLQCRAPGDSSVVGDGERATEETPWLGFHDDVFDNDVYTKFLVDMAHGNNTTNWQRAPIGGEMVTATKYAKMDTGYAALLTAVGDINMSQLGPGAPSTVETIGTDFPDRLTEMIQTMGYQFKLTDWSYRVVSGTVYGRVGGTNEGVAPFYYPWDVKISFQQSDVEVYNLTTGWDVRLWLPGNFGKTFAMPGMASGTYQVKIGIIDPLDSLPGIAFANDGSVLDAYYEIGTVVIP